MRKLCPLFEVDTFEEIVTNTKEVHKSLKNLGCFQSVNIEVDTLPDQAQEIYQVPFQPLNKMYSNFYPPRST